MSQVTCGEYPRPAFCGFHMKVHKTEAEQAVCDVDFGNYIRMQEEADDEALKRLGAELGKSVDEVRSIFREMAQAIWDGAVSPAGGGQ